KGYTAFTIDLSPLLRYGAVNTLLVKVDNAFNENMLPRGRSSDWAHDGGIYRPVQLLVTPKVYIERVAINADPEIGAKTASVEVTAVVRNSSSRAWEGEIGYRIDDQSSGAAAVKLAAGETQTVRLPRSTVRDPRL